jgi:hypothetical protein
MKDKSETEYIENSNEQYRDVEKTPTFSGDFFILLENN